MTADAGWTPESAPEVRPLPAPVFQLIYAWYYLTRPPRNRASGPPDWRVDLSLRNPELVSRLRGQSHLGRLRHRLFVLAGELGYWRDPGLGRFLRDVPALPGRLRDTLAQAAAADRASAGLLEQFDGLPPSALDFPEALLELWDALEPVWQDRGLPEVLGQCRQFEHDYRLTGDVIKALPAHHFTRFERAAANIRTAEGRQQIIVVPLYFASAGGFSFDGDNRRFVGYGLAAKGVFDDIRDRAEAEARSIKALSDPTRLMLLSLIARYSGFSLTVGDLAMYLGVSQPTVSGHLKVLRDSGLVRVERQGNRSYYRSEAAALRQLLTEMAETLLPD